MEFSGTVVHGDGYGRQLGYPTANITLSPQTQALTKAEQGIYAGTVRIHETDEWFQAAIVINQEAGKDIKCEAHLLDYTGDLYGQEVTFKLYEFIREYEAYETEDELITAIAEDIIKIRMVCAHYANHD